MPERPPDEDVIPLSRWRAALARARRGRKLDALLSEKDVDQLIPQLPVQELYYAITEVGLADAQELLALATPEQIQGFVDLDAWQRDRLDETRLEPWLNALVDLGPEPLLAAVEGLDTEVFALYVQRMARVYDLSLDTPPEEPEGHFFATPDRFFLLDVLPEGERGKALERMIDWLYRADLERARQVLMSAKWELPSDLEEWSLRWRSGRMADLGYIDFYEALEIYRYLDPASVSVGEGSSQTASSEPIELPAVLAGAFDEPGLLGQALGRLPQGADLERLQGALLTLLNKVMSADRVDPADVDAARRSMARAVAFLGLGLDLLGRGDLDRAGQALATIALERIFRVGVSLTLQLRRLAESLANDARIQQPPPIGPGLLLDPPFDLTLAALRRRPPEFPRALDPDRSPEDSSTRPFARLADVARTAAALEEAAAAPVLVYEALGVAPEDLVALATACAVGPGELRFGEVVRTLAAQALLGRGLSLRPLEASELGALAAHLAGDALGPAALAAVRALYRERLLGLQAIPASAEAWLDRWLDRFGARAAQPGGLLVAL